MPSLSLTLNAEPGNGYLFVNDTIAKMYYFNAAGLCNHFFCPPPETQPGKAGNNKLQTPSTKQIPKYNIQISNKIQRQLFGILNFSHCDLFVICYLSIVIY
jgi:hypothetical protein